MFRLRLILKKVFACCVAALVLVLMGFVSNADYQYEQESKADYCEKVAAGYWGDYDNSVECE